TNRWDYVSTYQHRGGEIVHHIMTVIFKNDALIRTEGNYFAQNAKQMLKASKAYEGEYTPSLEKGKQSNL
ncbi:MAG TPA: outer membrane protein assembly factor BamE, partial [Mizugakiibacter sp.]|nr:outer membrane protein assembly factor BamE [Mizugakiibacter sp.]